MLDPRMPPREQCVLRYVLDHFAQTTPDKIFVRFSDGTGWTYAEMRTIARTAAAGLRALGVEQGDHVATLLPNGREAIEVWYGINYLGAVYVPINPGYRGRLLAHALDVADARLLVCHHKLVERLDGVELHRVTDVLHVCGDGAQVAGVRHHPPGALGQSGDDPGEPDRPIEPWDTWGIMFTSGTTGPSKGVLTSYMLLWALFGPETMPFYTGDDRYMMTMPLFHNGGCGVFHSMLLRGGSLAFVERFSTSTFLSTARETNSTVAFLLGTMASFLESLPPGPQDRDHGLRLLWVVPVVDDMPSFAQRFGVEVRALYGMTELSSPVISEPNPSVAGSSGRVRPGVDVRIVDANDCELPPGQAGEILVRTDAPWAMNHGYYKNAEATAKAWRNGWFHTGDAGRFDEDGNFFFVDRMKDAVRRRGEYVSSLELEIEINAHPHVATSAVVGVPSGHGEEEVLAYIVAAPDTHVDERDITAFLCQRVPHFMVPRYLMVIDALPMTPTEKVQKHLLRSRGLPPDAWDREQAGIVVKAERI